MSVAEFLAELSQRGISIWAEGDQLHYRAARDALTPSLREELSQRKAAILAFLRQPPSRPATDPPPLVPAKREGAIPLSFAQERLWFLQQLEPESFAYVEPNAMQLAGRIAVETLEKSINAVVQRHENLRTTFINIQGTPCQVIAATVHLSLPIIDLTALPAREHEAEMRRLFAGAGHNKFDLSRGPLLHFFLLRLAENEHILLTTLHHIISDRTSGNLFLQDMLTCYKAYTDGDAQQASSSLPDLPVQYADYAIWQRDWLQGATLEHYLHYWRQQLDGAPSLLELPTDFPRPAKKSYRGSHYLFTLPLTLHQDLRALSTREGATIFMTLLAAYQTLLMRSSGQRDIVVGTSVTSRGRIELEPLIGLFINTLALRTDLSGNPTFRQLLKRVRDVCLSAYEHQNLPFEKLVEELQPERTLSYSPFFQVAFTLEHMPISSVESAGVTLEPVAWTNNTAKFDLSLTLAEARSGLRGNLEYNTDLFTSETIARFVRHLQTLLESMVANPDQHLADLPLLSEAEREHLLGAWDRPLSALPDSRCLHEIFEDQAAKQPDAIALVFEDQQITYAELNARANQLAYRLQALGVGPEVRVGLCLDRSIEMVVGLLAVLKAGGAYVPLDPHSPVERLAFMLADSQIAVLLTHPTTGTELPPTDVPVLALSASWGAELARQPTGNSTPSATPGNLAYILYTSGSTGQPKGVLITHHQLAHYVHACLSELPLAAGAHPALLQPLTVDSSVTLLYAALCLGQTLHLFSREQALDPIEMSAAFQAQAIDCLKIAPSHLRALQEVVTEPLMPSRLLVIGGEASSWEWVQGLARKHSVCQVVNHYGPTETTVGVLIYPVSTQAQPDEPVYTTTPLGRPLPRTQAYVLDERLEPVPLGMPGELYLGGAGLARGYLNRPDLTAERFLPHPFSAEPGERLYRTGDWVRARPNGVLEFLGRIDDQLKLHGLRIEPGEIEAILARHPAIQVCAVVVWEDTSGEKRLVAYLTPANGHAELTPGELRYYLQGKLPEPMVPAAFVVLEALPLTPHGKLDRRALPAPDWTRQTTTNTYVAPRTPTEERLAHLWAQLLRCERVGIHDNFFELGGHSLLATQLIARVFETFHCSVPLRALFEAPTLAGFAARLGNQEAQQRADIDEEEIEAPLVRGARYSVLAQGRTQSR
jgi:amino acid adenylation domain-containing protein